MEKNFDKIYAKHYEGVLRYVTFSIKDYNHAKEITNDVFAKSARYLKDFDESRGTFVTLLGRITNTTIIDHVRKNTVKVIPVSKFINDDGYEYFQFVDNDARTNEFAENNELKVKLNRAFSSLSPRYKKIALLFFVKDKSYNEIATMLNIPLGTVKPSIFRIRKALQKKLMYEKKEYNICNNTK